MINFYQEPKMQTLAIKFTDKEILLKKEMKRINSADTVTEQLSQYRNATYNSVFNHETTINMSKGENNQRKRRNIKGCKGDNKDGLFYAQNHANTGLNGEKVTNSDSRQSSWINDLVGWVKGSIGQWFNRYAVIDEVFYAQNHANPSMVDSIIPEIDGSTNQSDGLEINTEVVNNTLLLGDVAARLITGNKYKQPKHDSLLSPKELIERRMDHIAIKAISNFDKVCYGKYDLQNVANGKPMTCFSNVSLEKSAINMDSKKGISCR